MPKPYGRLRLGRAFFLRWGMALMWMLLMFGLGKSLLAGANLLVSAKQLREALPRVGFLLALGDGAMCRVLDLGR